MERLQGQMIYMILGLNLLSLVVIQVKKNVFGVVYSITWVCGIPREEYFI
jgi:hypothetical protein